MKFFCESCENFLGCGDWNLCCKLKYDLCYETTPTCDKFKMKHNNGFLYEIKPVDSGTHFLCYSEDRGFYWQSKIFKSESQDEDILLFMSEESCMRFIKKHKNEINRQAVPEEIWINLDFYSRKYCDLLSTGICPSYNECRSILKSQCKLCPKEEQK